MSLELEKLCKDWLDTNFDYTNIEIKATKVLEQTEIDKALDLVGVKFDFVDGIGRVGDAVAFFDIGDVLFASASQRRIVRRFSI